MSPRRKTFEGCLYFVTITVVGWIDVFTRKEYVYDLMENIKYCQENKGLEIYAYVIMTNHIHLIARVNDTPLNLVLRDLKSYTSKRLIEMIKDNPQESRKEWLLYMFKFFGKKVSQDYQLWQHKNYPIELYSPEVIKQKIEYIHNNPVRAGIVAQPHEYLYSSANQFSIIKVLEV